MLIDVEAAKNLMVMRLTQVLTLFPYHCLRCSAIYYYLTRQSCALRKKSRDRNFFPGWLKTILYCCVRPVSELPSCVVVGVVFCVHSLQGVGETAYIAAFVEKQALFPKSNELVSFSSS